METIRDRLYENSTAWFGLALFLTALYAFLLYAGVPWAHWYFFFEPVLIVVGAVALAETQSVIIAVVMLLYVLAVIGIWLFVIGMDWWSHNFSLAYIPELIHPGKHMKEYAELILVRTAWSNLNML